MKALILAGGYGTRLRPLSCTRPKQLFPVANRPVIDWILERLAKNGVKEVVLAVNYLAEDIKRAIGYSRYGVKIVYSHEKRPLGTGGPIKMAEELLRDDVFLVLNGDILCELNYRELAEKHKEYNATATIALYRVKNVERFGVVYLDENNRVVEFIEKPSHEVRSNLINAGTYAMSSDIFEYMQPNKKISIEREVFPIISKAGKLYGYEFNGFWADVGELSDYLHVNEIMLKKLSREKPILGDGVKMGVNVKLIPPIIIGENVEIGDGSQIGPYVSIGDNCIVGTGTRLERSVVFPHALLGNFSSVRSAVVGQGAIIGQWVKIDNQVVIGDSVVISDNLTLVNGVSICPYKEINSSIYGPRHIA